MLRNSISCKKKKKKGESNFHSYDCKRSLKECLSWDEIYRKIRRWWQVWKWSIWLTLQNKLMEKAKWLESRWLLKRLLIMIATLNLHFTQRNHYVEEQFFCSLLLPLFTPLHIWGGSFWGRRTGYLFFGSKWQALREHHQLWRRFFSEYTGKPWSIIYTDGITMSILQAICPFSC